LGIELDAALAAQSRKNAAAAGVADRVSIVQGDVLTADFSQASVVTVYLLPDLVGRLEPRFLSELKPGTRIVSHQFDMGTWKPEQKVELNGRTIYLWTIPQRAN
jgi:hypothetical protein